MPDRATHLDRFLGRLYLRYVALRLVERTGVGLLAGCAAALPLLCIAWFRGLPTVLPSLVLLGIGAAAGAWWGVLTRPTRAAAAMEADRQLRWADLLGSALAVRGRAAGDPWAAAAVAEADARCRSASPSQVILNRLGAGTWSGIGLATALVLVLACLPLFATPSRAGDRTDASSDRRLVLLRPDASTDRSTTGTSRRASHPRSDPDEEDAHRNPSPADASQSTSRDPASPTDAAPRESMSQDGHGSGQGHSESPSRHSPRQGNHAGHSATPAIEGGTVTSGGDGSSTSNAGAKGDETSSGIAASAQTSRAIPPWHSDQWPAQGQRARDAMNAGQIPDRYRDMIRGYFAQP